MPASAALSSEKRRALRSSARTGTDHLRRSVSASPTATTPVAVGAARRPFAVTTYSGRRRAAPLRGDHVLGPERMAVALVAPDEAARDHRAERAHERLAPDVQPP